MSFATTASVEVADAATGASTGGDRSLLPHTRYYGWPGATVHDEQEIPSVWGCGLILASAPPGFAATIGRRTDWLQAGRRGQVRLTGFLMTGPAGQPYLARMSLVCCAADAGPIKVGLTGQMPAGLKPDIWVDVTGRYTAQSDKDHLNGLLIPYLDVVDLKPVPPPSGRYES